MPATFNLFLLDGTAEGAIKCSTRGQDTIVYRIPREDLNKYMSNEDLKKAGIYFLVGKIDGKKAIYVGQGNTRKNGNGVLGRVLEHKKPTEAYWKTAFILISNSDWITATELNYLENQFCYLANSAGEYYVVNAWDPSLGKVSDETRVTMEPFIEYAKLALKLQGYRPFEKREIAEGDSQSSESEAGGIMLSLSLDGDDGRKANARCLYRDEKFIVLKGSLVATVPSGSCSNAIKNKRVKNAGLVDKKGILKQDIIFNSPSGAAAFVSYANCNGKILWKLEDGRLLKEIL
nr:GIY-YIG nuclease family protein [uncultured Butyrivibrio sp.]